MKRSIVTLSCLGVIVSALAWSSVQEEEGGMPPMAQPGKQHEVLKRKVGTWNTTMVVEGMPGENRGTQEYRLGPGGLWLIGDFKGDFMGSPFTGHEVQGYDATKGKYVATWVDSWTDKIMFIEGDFDEAKNSLILWTDSKDFSGNPVRERHVTHFIDADNFEFRIEQPGPDGEYAPMMTITYERQK